MKNQFLGLNFMSGLCHGALKYILKTTRNTNYNQYILCLFVSLYPTNVKTAEPIGPKFFVEPHMIPAKVYMEVRN